MKKRKKAEVKDQTRPDQARVGKRTAVQTPLGKKARVRPWRHAACSLPAPRRPAAHAAVLAPRPAPVPTPPWRLPTADCRLPQGNCSARMARRQQQRWQKKIPPRPAALAVCFLLRGSKPRQCRHTGTKARRQVGLQRPHPAQGQAGDFRRAPGAGPAAGAAPRAQTGDQVSDQASDQAGAAARIIAPCPLPKFCSASMPWACA